MSASVKTAILVPGGWHGPSSYSLLIPLLEERGLQVIALTLPSVGVKPGHSRALSDDLAVLRKAVEEATGDIVVVCHSYGGKVTSGALEGLSHRVKALVYVCAEMADVGKGLPEYLENPWPWLDIQGNVAYVRNPETTFYEGFPPALKVQLLREISSHGVFFEMAQYAAWKDIPTTYVMGLQDDVIPLSVQEQFASQRTNIGDGGVKVERLDTNHWPMVHMPEELAAIIAKAVSDSSL